ncbi:MAG: membrane-associated protein [Verrucomicrobiales bacterium]
MIGWAVDVFESVEELITELSQNPWFFAILFAVALLDSVIPIVPSEFSVIAGGVASGAGTLIDGRPVLSIVLVIICGATGAYLGDSLAYWIGSRSDKALKRIFFRGDKGDDRLFATGEQIRKRGGLLLITARFIPGGRTAMTFSSGLTGQPFWSWFTRWDLLAVTLWASYAGLLGYFVAGAIENQTTALWLAFGFALGLTVLIELVRWLFNRRRNRSRAETVGV